VPEEVHGRRPKAPKGRVAPKRSMIFHFGFSTQKHKASKLNVFIYAQLSQKHTKLTKINSMKEERKMSQKTKPE